MLLMRSQWWALAAISLISGFRKRLADTLHHELCYITRACRCLGYLLLFISDPECWLRVFYANIFRRHIYTFFHIETPKRPRNALCHCARSHLIHHWSEYAVVVARRWQRSSDPTHALLHGHDYGLRGTLAHIRGTQRKRRLRGRDRGMSPWIG